MSSFLSVLLVSLLPAVGTLAGVLVAESWRMPAWVVGAALHAAAGIAIAVIAVEMMPEILPERRIWLPAGFLLLGAAFSLALERLVDRLRRTGGASSGAWMVHMAVSADLLSDGLMIGVGSAVSQRLGLLLAIAQVVANIPGGFATAANFREQGVPRRRRLLLAASFVLPAVAAANLGFWLLRGLSSLVHAMALAFVVGILLAATIEDMVPQADESRPRRSISTAALAGGFVFLLLLSAYLGE